MSKVKVQFVAFGHESKGPGDSGDFEEDEAKRLIRAGVAVAATVSDAKAAGVDPSDAATKR